MILLYSDAHLNQDYINRYESELNSKITSCNRYLQKMGKEAKENMENLPKNKEKCP